MCSPSETLKETMNRLLLFFSTSVLVMGGCARHYKITLNNNNVITTRSKPKLDQASGTYLFKDALGRPASLPAFRIKEIESK